jgi:hypothetical protein
LNLVGSVANRHLLMFEILIECRIRFMLPLMAYETNSPDFVNN